ncbi:MAG: SpoIIE family protein phosphatase [Bacteroidales bacterium]
MQKVPKYRGLRVLVTPVILYYMLIFPMIGMIYITNAPKLIDLEKLESAFARKDSLANIEAKEPKLNNKGKEPDSLSIPDENEQDSVVKSKGINIGIKTKDDNNILASGEKLFFNCFLISLILGFLFSIPFKIFFRRKRKGLSIPPKIDLYCKKTILYSPLITAFIISIPFLVQNLNLINHLFISNTLVEKFRRDTVLQYWAIFLLASVLTILYTYFWQKHKMQIRYLHHIFLPDELKKSIYKRKGGKIRNRLLFTSVVTSLLPLCIVASYLLMSITSLSEIGLKNPGPGDFKVIFGEYTKLFESVDLQEFITENNLFYINAIDTFLMFIGTGAGIFVTIIYIISFVRWTNSDIISPVQELLFNMQKTTGGQLQNYSVVRTNDELGELSENYNVMTGKLYEYVSHIDRMNAELDQKVKERTAEVIAQKEEIEAQRDELESQRDEIERQRDYVIEQRDFIINQKKAITDSIEYAGNIQKAILPPIEYLKKTLGDHFILFKPRDIVSGDFYWAYQIKPGKVMIVVADCTGHGVPGAFMSMLGITLLNEIIIKNEIINPAEVLDHLKENVVNSLHQTHETGKSKDGIDISVCLVDYKKKKLKYAGAYNSVYVIRGYQDENEVDELKMTYFLPDFNIETKDKKVLVELKADKNPIGISVGHYQPYKLKEFEIKENDVIYLFSDGFADQFGGKKRLKFLYSRFKNVLIDNSLNEMDVQLTELGKSLQLWMGHEKQIDDILVLGLKMNQNF